MTPPPITPSRIDLLYRFRLKKPGHRKSENLLFFNPSLISHQFSVISLTQSLLKLLPLVVPKGKLQQVASPSSQCFDSRPSSPSNNSKMGSGSGSNLVRQNSSPDGLLSNLVVDNGGLCCDMMKYRYAMVCSSNQNRSMEAHSLMKRQGFDVSSYGTGAHVKLPGPSLREPNVYEFGTPYKQMFDDLRRKDPKLYKRNGILPMLKRNSTVKLAPQRWQENAADGSFDVVFTFEEKVFDIVVEDLIIRDHVLMKCVLVINLEVKDNHEEAAIGARLALDLCQEIESAESWEDSIDEILNAFEAKDRRKLLYSISFC